MDYHYLIVNAVSHLSARIITDPSEPGQLRLSHKGRTYPIELESAGYRFVESTSYIATMIQEDLIQVWDEEATAV